MPSKPTKLRQAHPVFLPLLTLTFLLWLFYRSVFVFPVWFDETLGKLVFFALPVLLYISVTGYRAVLDSFALPKLKPGLLLGLAIGGLFGFAGLLLGALSRGGQVQLVPYYLADWFWWELFLGLLTSFWETLFFFSFVMLVVLDKFKRWSLSKQVAFVGLVFMLFHLPNALINFSLRDSLWQIMLLFAFACGQALIFYQRRNAYTLVITQALWGMVLLLNF